jgi:cyclopropane fatty-acyl-phospholipid synthase-like methyltransferase
MRNVDNYKKYFTKEYMMGPNALRLLDEIVTDNSELVSKGNVLDLGCGAALSSLYLAKETTADTVWALDLWVSVTDNWKRIKENGLEDKIIPIHGDALAMPFAHEYFDCVITVDTYHYFGCEEKVFAEKILPFLKKGGYTLIAVPGVKEEPAGELKALMEEWAGDETYMFKTKEWWTKHIIDGCENQVEVTVYESAQFDFVWQEWCDSGHEYGIRDKEFLEKGLKDILNFVMIVVKKKGD